MPAQTTRVDAHGKTKKIGSPTPGPKRKRKRKRKPKTVSNDQIAQHPMLGELDKRLCQVFRDQARRAHEDFSMDEYAEIALKACARNYTEAVDGDRLGDALLDLKRLKHAAALYFREMLAAAGGEPDLLFPFEAVGRIFS